MKKDINKAKSKKANLNRINWDKINQKISIKKGYITCNDSYVILFKPNMGENCI